MTRIWKLGLMTFSSRFEVSIVIQPSKEHVSFVVLFDASIHTGQQNPMLIVTHHA